MVLYRWQKINEQVFCSDCCIDIIISLNLFGFWIKKNAYLCSNWKIIKFFNHFNVIQTCSN